MARSTVQRWRPSRCEDSSPPRAMRWAMPCSRNHRRRWAESQRLSGWSLPGLPRRHPRRERIGGMPFTNGIRAWLSCRSAPEVPIDMSRPDRRAIRRFFELTCPGQQEDPSGPLLQSPYVHRVDRAPRPVRLTTSAELVEGQVVELGPHPGLRPLREPPVSRRTGQTERRRRQLLPGTTRRCHEDDRGQHLPVPTPASTTALRPRRHLRHHPLEQLPQHVRHKSLNDPHHGSQSTESSK